MIKKAILAAGISLLCLAPVYAEEPATLTDRIDRVDEVIYGSAQDGSLISRVDNAVQSDLMMSEWIHCIHCPDCRKN